MTMMLASLWIALPAACVLAAPEGEFIRVAEDNWTFETSVSHTRFIPFGTNFVLTEKRTLNLFGPEVYDPERYERTLAALEGLGFNIVKVFLPIGNVLADPQAPGEARIAPGYLDNLADFLRMARAHRVRVVVTLASWGGNGIEWWHEGGQYFGRKPWRADEGIDSLDVLWRFWTKLCARFRDDPTVFSYNMAAEWTFPASNLTWIRPDKQHGRLETEPGLFYWRAFLRARYDGDIATLNESYGTEHEDFTDVPIVDFTYHADTKQYADPDAKIVDYQNFREWASMRYLAPQIAACRAAEPNHMVTIGNHMRRPIGLWEGAARHFMGFSVPEQSDLVDYLTTHDNHSEARLRPGQTIADVVHSSILRTRFCNAFKMMPVIIEEFTFASPDEQRMADAQAKMVLGAVGHASGWMNWYLQYPHDPNQADMAGQDRSAILNDDLTPTAWGLRAKALIQQLKSADLSRESARTVVEVDRERELAPRAWGPVLTICRDWDTYEHPIDFRWPRNEWIHLKLIEER